VVGGEGAECAPHRKPGNHHHNNTVRTTKSPTVTGVTGQHLHCGPTGSVHVENNLILHFSYFVMFTYLIKANQQTIQLLLQRIPKASDP
jgi:hypothetical protein